MDEDERQRRIGLCLGCRHGRRLGNRRGSSFYRCEKARLDSSLRPYPALPVEECPGYERGSKPDPEA